MNVHHGTSSVLRNTVKAGGETWRESCPACSKPIYSYNFRCAAG